VGILAWQASFGCVGSGLDVLGIAGYYLVVRDANGETLDKA